VDYLNKYTPLLSGVAGYVHKQEKLETLTVYQVNQGKIIMNETVKKT
jgi:hypothetical protein